MKTMYIASNNCVERGMFLGDMLVAIKTAWLFVENEPHDGYVLSLQVADPWNYLWARFIRENKVQVIYESGWANGNKLEQYIQWQERRRTRRVHDFTFDTYKELYPRLEGSDRQSLLCGRENGLGRRNICEYFYFGQESWVDNPVNTTRFGSDVVDVPQVEKTGHILIAPHEKCQGNQVFTLDFWRRVMSALPQPVLINTKDQFGCGTSIFPPASDVLSFVAAQRVVACGNTGIGWAAGAVGTPLIACERDMNFSEYSFRASGVESLRAIIDAPEPHRVIDAVASVLLA
jgi:hypothetical protein